MARLTDRTALTAPVDGDLVHVVDVSDPTDSAEGTSKKTTYQNLLGPAGINTTTSTTSILTTKDKLNVVGTLGINEASPVTKAEMTHTEPYFTLHNSTEEDTDLGRECRWIARGEQSGGEESILGYTEFSHDGTADDEAGIYRILLNDGNDATSPTERFRMLRTGYAGFNKTAPSERLEIDGSLKGGASGVDDSFTLSNSSGVAKVALNSASSSWLTCGLALTPRATETLVAATGITSAMIDANAVIHVVGSGGATLAITATPSIASGLPGQLLTIIGTDDTNSITLQDESSLASSGLQLAGGADAVLGQYDTLVLIYSSVLGKWCELSRSDN